MEVTLPSVGEVYVTTCSLNNKLNMMWSDPIYSYSEKYRQSDYG